MEGDRQLWVGAQAGTEGSSGEVKQQEEPEYLQGLIKYINILRRMGSMFHA